MRASALLVFTLWCLPAVLLAQGDAATGEVVATVRTESGAPLAEAEVRSDSSGTLTDAQGIARLTLPAGRRRLSVARMLIDPVYANRASPVSFAGPRRVRPPGVRFDDLPPISLVLLSHNHYDHCDLGTLKLLEQRFSPAAVTPPGNGRLLRAAGFRQIEELDWWETSSSAPLPVTVTPAQHFSARTPLDRNRALWGGFIIEGKGRRILHAGDSGYGPHFREIGERLGPIDLALLPIGAYEPRWFMKDIHMNPAEAVQAHLDLGARESAAMHFGTFQLTPEGIDQPVRDLRVALEDRGVPAEQFRIMDAGDSLPI
jgi:L-ascorbate metabolism protein UlaG (beta-lactamase superfamily)